MLLRWEKESGHGSSSRAWYVFTESDPSLRFFRLALPLPLLVPMHNASSNILYPPEIASIYGQFFPLYYDSLLVWAIKSF